MKRILSTSLFLLSAFALLAEGYQVNMQSQKQTGMGHTGAGQKLGATSIHFNPGAMAFMPGKFDFSFGASGVFSKNSFVNVNGGPKSESDNPMGTPLFFYGAGQISEKFAAGIGVTSPFGNSIKWGDDWQGRYLIQDISLQAIFVTPTLSYKLTDKLSIGAGFVMTFGGVELNRAINFTGLNPIYRAILADPNAVVPDGQVNLKGNTTSYGYTLGLFFQPTEKLSLGLSYRSKVLLEMEGGDADFTYIPQVPTLLSTAVTMQGGTVPANYEWFPANNKFSSELPMPSNLTFGLGWQAGEKFLIAVDLQMVGWSAYKSLKFDFEKESGLQTALNPVVGVADSEMPKKFENTMIYRLGASYTPSASIILRAGVYYDETPIPKGYLTPETPGTNKVGASLGISWFLNEKLSVDASLLHIKGEERKDGSDLANFKGTYTTSAWLPGIGISYTF